MTWLDNIFQTHSAIQAVIVISLICAVGLTLGKMRIRGLSLGVTYVFFIGILAGAIGLDVDAEMLSYAESFGLVLFVYILGLQVGPGFISGFKEGGGAQLNFMALAVILIGTLMALAFVWSGVLRLPDAMGILCGATTNTPALGAAQQTFRLFGDDMGSSTAALATAVTYPLGLVGVILAFVVMKGWLLRREKTDEGKENAKEAFICSFLVCNPAIYNHKISEIAQLAPNLKFVVSRLWRDGKVQLPNADTLLQENDRIMVITERGLVEKITIFFGRRDETDWNRKNIDWNSIDTRLVSQRILITRSEINGKHLGELQLRNRHGVNVSRVQRAGIQLVATPELILRLGDRLTVIGETDSIKRVADELGNAVKRLDEPNMVTIFVGIVLGLVLGCIPFQFPGMNYPVQLGLAGGPIIMGILIGAFGPRFHMVAYTTTSANLMLRSLGLSIYLACLGLDAGKDFIATVISPSALVWIGVGFLITILPIVIVSIVAVKYYGKRFATMAGMICGAMANPIALDYVNEQTQDNDKASVAYASVYPLSMFARVIIAQIAVMLFLNG